QIRRQSIPQSSVHEERIAAATGSIAHISVLARIAGGGLICGPQRSHEIDQCRNLRRPQVLAISRHVPAPLNYLPDQLIARETSGDRVQGRPAQSAFAAESVTIAALLALD